MCCDGEVMEVTKITRDVLWRWGNGGNKNKKELRKEAAKREKVNYWIEDVSKG